MCCGVIGDRLMLPVGPKGYETALTRPQAKPMDFTGKPMKGLAYVEPAGVASGPAFVSTSHARGTGRGPGR